MNKSLKALLVASALASASLIGTATVASAQPTGSSFRVGDVAIGYQNGYYDRSNRWHNWRTAREHNWYRSNYRASYRARAYDRDRDGIPNRYDRDRDNDGVANRYDRNPNNPYRR
jgi:hypothetical protein